MPLPIYRRAPLKTLDFDGLAVISTKQKKVFYCCCAPETSACVIGAVPEMSACAPAAAAPALSPFSRPMVAASD
jgi:hypothetical protein